MERPDETKWDDDMGFLLTVARQYIINLSNESDVSLCESWLDKLTNDDYRDGESKKRRNVYLTNLIQAMERGKLEGPFTSPPPAAGSKLANTLNVFASSSLPGGQGARHDAGDFNSSSVEGNMYVATKTLPDGKGAFGFVAVSLDESELKMFRQESKTEVRTKIGPKIVRQEVRQKYTQFVKPSNEKHRLPPTPPHFSPTQAPFFSSRVDAGAATPHSFYNLGLSPIGTQPRMMRSFGTPLPAPYADTEPSLSFDARRIRAAARAARPVDVTPAMRQPSLPLGTPVRRPEDRRYVGPVRRPLFAGPPVEPPPVETPRRVFVPAPYEVGTPVAPIPRPDSPPRLVPAPRYVGPSRIPLPRQLPPRGGRQVEQIQVYPRETPVQVPDAPRKRIGIKRTQRKKIVVEDAGRKSPSVAPETPKIDDLIRTTVTEQEGFIEEPTLPPQKVGKKKTKPRTIERPAHEKEEPVDMSKRRSSLKDKIKDVKLVSCIVGKKSVESDKQAEGGGSKIVLYENVVETVEKQQKRDRDALDRQPRKVVREPERPADVSKEEYWKQFEDFDVKKYMTQRPMDVFHDIIKRGYALTTRESYGLPEEWNQYVDMPLSHQHSRLLNETYPKVLIDKVLELLKKHKVIIARGKQEEFEVDKKKVVEDIKGMNRETIEVRKTGNDRVIRSRHNSYYYGHEALIVWKSDLKSDRQDTQIKEQYFDLKRALDNVVSTRVRQQQQFERFGTDAELEKTLDDVGREEHELRKQTAYRDQLHDATDNLITDHELDMKLYEQSIRKLEEENGVLRKNIEALTTELSIVQRRIDEARSGGIKESSDEESVSPVKDDEGWW